jgi:hypothetical protein
MHINGNPVESAKIGSRVGIKTDKNVRENDKVFIVKC